MRSNKSLIEKIEEVKGLKRQQKEIENRIKELENTLKSEMVIRGTNELTLEGWTLRISPVNGNRFDTKAFNKDYPEIYEKYSKPTYSDRFYILKEGR